MATKIVSSPFNPARLHVSLGNLLGPNFWSMRIADDARSVAITLDPQIEDRATDVDNLVAAHQSTFAADELTDYKTRAYGLIDFKAGEVSRKYITERTAQEVTYQIKSASAKAWNSNGKPSIIDRVSYPGLYADVMARRAVDPSFTIQATVDDILNTEALWYYKADQIEEARRRGKLQVGVSTTMMDATNKLTDALYALSQL